MTVVPLKQRDLFTKRWKGLETLDPSELAIQIALVARLKQELRDDVVFYHCPNGGYRDKRSAQKLKAMGVLPGVADLVFHSRRPTLFLELKAPGKKPSVMQDIFRARVEAIGQRYAVAQSVDEAMAIVEAYGLTRHYDPHDDVSKSFEEAYRAIRARMQAGGPPWKPK